MFYLRFWRFDDNLCKKVKFNRSSNNYGSLVQYYWYNVFLFICLFNQTEFPNENALIMFLVLIGIMSSFQQFFLAYSLKMAPVSLLAPLRYISVPIGIVVGIFIFDEVISTTFFLGTVIIVFSSFLIIKRETVKK